MGNGRCSPLVNPHQSCMVFGRPPLYCLYPSGLYSHSLQTFCFAASFELKISGYFRSIPYVTFSHVFSQSDQSDWTDCVLNLSVYNIVAWRHEVLAFDWIKLTNQTCTRAGRFTIHLRIPDNTVQRKVSYRTCFMPASNQHNHTLPNTRIWLVNRGDLWPLADLGPELRTEQLLQIKFYRDRSQAVPRELLFPLQIWPLGHTGRGQEGDRLIALMAT